MFQKKRGVEWFLFFCKPILGRDKIPPRLLRIHPSFPLRGRRGDISVNDRFSLI